MTNMPNAPLIYTLGMVRFPRVPEIEKYADAFHGLIRGEYPIHAAQSLPVMTATFGPDGLSVGTQQTWMLQLTSPDKKWAFLLTEELLALHTEAYTTHQDFIAKFTAGLRALLRVPGIGIDWVEAVGMRYVDLIAPRADETLEQYLRPSILPAVGTEAFEGLSILEGMYVGTYRSKVGDLRLQVLRNPPTALPPELDTPLLQRNGWRKDRPVGEFAVVDIDHGCRLDPMMKIDVDVVGSKMHELRAVVKDLFLASGTEHALEVWNEKREQ